MRRQLLAVFAILALAATPSWAVNGNIGIYFDTDAALCQGNVPQGPPVRMYVYALLQGASLNGITGVEYKVQEGPNNAADPAGYLFHGDLRPDGDRPWRRRLQPGSTSARGVNVAWPACQIGDGTKVLIETVDVLNPLGSTAEMMLKVVKHDIYSNQFFKCPLFVLCDEPVYTKVCVGYGVVACAQDAAAEPAAAHLAVLDERYRVHQPDRGPRLPRRRCAGDLVLGQEPLRPLIASQTFATRRALPRAPFAFSRSRQRRPPDRARICYAAGRSRILETSFAELAATRTPPPAAPPRRDWPRTRWRRCCRSRTVLRSRCQGSLHRRRGSSRARAGGAGGRRTDARPARVASPRMRQDGDPGLALVAVAALGEDLASQRRFVPAVRLLHAAQARLRDRTSKLFLATLELGIELQRRGALDATAVEALARRLERRDPAPVHAAVHVLRAEHALLSGDLAAAVAAHREARPYARSGGLASLRTRQEAVAQALRAPFADVEDWEEPLRTVSREELAEIESRPVALVGGCVAPRRAPPAGSARRHRHPRPGPAARRVAHSRRGAAHAAPSPALEERAHPAG